ncbi:spore coat protein, partial [Bacillus spizizenii]|nr:spore coat protein [Bacillus spizizenii]
MTDSRHICCGPGFGAYPGYGAGSSGFGMYGGGG